MGITFINKLKFYTMTAHEIIRNRLEKLWWVLPTDPVSPSLFDDHASRVIKELDKHYYIIPINEVNNHGFDPEIVGTIEESLKDLQDTMQLLTDRISDLHEVRGMQGERHAFVFYRNKLSYIIHQLSTLIK